MSTPKKPQFISLGHADRSDLGTRIRRAQAFAVVLVFADPAGAALFEVSVSEGLTPVQLTKLKAVFEESISRIIREQEGA